MFLLGDDISTMNESLLSALSSSFHSKFLHPEHHGAGYRGSELELGDLCLPRVTVLVAALTTWVSGRYLVGGLGLFKVSLLPLLLSHHSIIVR